MKTNTDFIENCIDEITKEKTRFDGVHKFNPELKKKVMKFALMIAKEELMNSLPFTNHNDMCRHVNNRIDEIERVQQVNWMEPDSLYLKKLRKKRK